MEAMHSTIRLKFSIPTIYIPSSLKTGNNIRHIDSIISKMVSFSWCSKKEKVCVKHQVQLQ